MCRDGEFGFTMIHAISMAQVIPIYGRGGDNTDPRQKAASTGSRKQDEDDAAVPRRPAGQRMGPVPVNLTLATDSVFSEQTWRELLAEHSALGLLAPWPEGR